MDYIRIISTTGALYLNNCQFLVSQQCVFVKKIPGCTRISCYAFATSCVTSKSQISPEYTEVLTVYTARYQVYRK
jgi:hypothetical protein